MSETSPMNVAGVEFTKCRTSPAVEINIPSRNKEMLADCDRALGWANPARLRDGTYWSWAKGLVDYHQQLIAFVRTLGRQRDREMVLQKIKAETYPKGYDYPIYVILEAKTGQFDTFFFTEQQAKEYLNNDSVRNQNRYLRYSIRSIPPENKELRQLLDLIAMVGVTGEVPKT